MRFSSLTNSEGNKLPSAQETIHFTDGTSAHKTWHFFA